MTYSGENSGTENPPPRRDDVRGVLSVRELKRQRRAIDTVTQSGRQRPIVEDVPQVATTPAALHFGARHKITAVGCRPDGVLERREEARPPGATFELVIGHEERLLASRAPERPRPMFREQRA